MPYSKLDPDRRCTAMCRSRGERCRNAPAYGCKTCRYHGAKRQEATKVGAEHGRYKTGYYTQDAKAMHKATTIRLMDLEEIGFRLGIMAGKRTPGRKPGR